MAVVVVPRPGGLVMPLLPLCRGGLPGGAPLWCSPVLVLAPLFLSPLCGVCGFPGSAPSWVWVGVPWVAGLVLGPPGFGGCLPPLAPWVRSVASLPWFLGPLGWWFPPLVAGRPRGCWLGCVFAWVALVGWLPVAFWLCFPSLAFGGMTLGDYQPRSAGAHC